MVVNVNNDVGSTHTCGIYISLQHSLVCPSKDPICLIPYDVLGLHALLLMTDIKSDLWTVNHNHG